MLNDWADLEEFDLIFFFVPLWDLLDFFILMMYDIKNKNVYYTILYSHFSQINTPFYVDCNSVWHSYVENADS